MEQATLFPDNPTKEQMEYLVLVALGDFQSRGKVLIDRELPLDRLRGAIRRAATSLSFAEPDDGSIADCLETLGARVVRVPVFVAKRPFRVTIPASLAARGAESFATLRGQV